VQSLPDTAVAMVKIGDVKHYLGRWMRRREDGDSNRVIGHRRIPFRRDFPGTGYRQTVDEQRVRGADIPQFNGERLALFRKQNRQRERSEP